MPPDPPTWVGRFVRSQTQQNLTPPPHLTTYSILIFKEHQGFQRGLNAINFGILVYILQKCIRFALFTCIFFLIFPGENTPEPPARLG